MAIFDAGNENTNVLLMQGAKASAFALGGVSFEQAKKGTHFFATSVGPINFIEHNFGDAQDKTSEDTSTTQINVVMTTLSHGEWFDARLETPESAAMKLIERFPKEIPGAIDKFLARKTTSDAWTGWTGTPAPISDADSFLVAQDALSAAGYEPTLSVWDNTSKRIVRSMLNEKTNRSDVAVNVQDGVYVGDTTAYFRKLYNGALSDGSPLGVVLDPNYTKVFLDSNGKVSVITGETDKEASDKNGIFARVEIGIGVATLQNSAVPLVAALSA